MLATSECDLDDGSFARSHVEAERGGPVMREQTGGRVSATQWPLRPGNAIDVYFDGKDSAYRHLQPHHYRYLYYTHYM